MKNLRSKIKNISLITILTGSIIFEIYALCKDDFEKDRLYNLIEKKADINKDSFTSNKEWKNVYDFLNKKYDLFSSYPRFELTLTEMNKYLNKK